MIDSLVAALPSQGLVIVEGVYSARPELAAYFDLVVFVDTPPEVSMRRLRERTHFHGPVDWEARWRLAEEHYIATTDTAARAHLIVPGH
jgi:uridine kinase